jgi:hypothetical protein
MPKTQFIDGQSLVTAAFLNKMYRTDGGHKHDGADADGHASKIALNTELTVGSNGTLQATSDTADVHAIRHDHAGSGNAILQADVLRLYGAPKDATRRAVAPLSGSLYSENVPKILYRAKVSGTSGAILFYDVETYNVSGGALAPHPDNSGSYILTPLDSGALGVVIATFEGITPDGVEFAPFDPCRVAAYWDSANGRVVVTPWVYQTTWKRLRGGGVTMATFSEEQAHLQIVVW